MEKLERFPDHLELRKLNGHDWSLQEPFRYRSAMLGWITAPVGFVTDLTSVPWFARWYVSVDGDHTKPAIIHDYLYTMASCADHPAVTRRCADAVFHEALIVRGIRPTMAWVLWAAVRIGGGRNFRKG